MMNEPPIVTLIGAGGFLGRYVVHRLAAAGYRLRVIVRNPDAALALKTAGDPGQISLVAGNLGKPETLTGKFAGSYAVVNLVGILFQGRGQHFDALQAKGAETAARLAAQAGARRFVQISALGVDKAFGSEYARSKLLGEKAVLGAFPAATILRPSVMFGAEDHFFNQFAAMPVHPLIGGGKTLFQPVYVDDVARAVQAAIEREDAAGSTYELGGPAVYSFRQLLAYVQSLTGKRPMLPLPFGLASFIGFKAELAYRLIPLIRKPFLTRDQVKLLRHDNVVSQGMKNFADLAIAPQPLEQIVPHYLSRFHPKKAL